MPKKEKDDFSYGHAANFLESGLQALYDSVEHQSVSRDEAEVLEKRLGTEARILVEKFGSGILEKIKPELRDAYLKILSMPDTDSSIS